MTRVCILNYGSGNLRSVYNLVSQFSDAVISNEVSEIDRASHLILPGVGAFGSSMQKINNQLPIDAIRHQINNGKYFLGICVGMQVLAEVGHEFEINSGLGWLPGSVVRLNCGQQPLPHVGWNNIKIKHSHPLLSQLDERADFYFLHSYVFKQIPEYMILAETEYGEYFPSVVGSGSVFGVQFHPEKSQLSGRQLIKNFLSLR